MPEHSDDKFAFGVRPEGRPSAPAGRVAYRLAGVRGRLAGTAPVARIFGPQIAACRRARSSCWNRRHAAICGPKMRATGAAMTAIDYETEYNNRARVPEHPQIFAQWTRDAAAYREQARAEKRAELGLKYGASARQTIDLLGPAGAPAAPLALFIHGGYWRSLEPSQFSHMAAGLNAHGV